MKTTPLRAGLLALAFPAAFVGGVAVQRAHADQPYMQQALDQLQGARASLAGAEANKDGHRIRALSLVDQAIAEVRMGIRAAR